MKERELVYLQLAITKSFIPVYLDSLTEKEKLTYKTKTIIFNPRIHKIPLDYQGKFDINLIKKGEEDED